MEKRSLLTGYALVLLGSALFASKAIFIKLAYRELPDAMLMLVWRMIFSLPFFLATWLFALRKPGVVPPGGRAMPLLQRAMLIGFVGYYLAMILDFMGLLYVSAQLERLALFTYPIFVMFLGAAFFRQKLTLGHLASAVISYAGLTIVFMADMAAIGPGVWKGTALVLLSALAFALYQLWAKELIAEMGSLLFTSVALTAASFTSILHFVVMRGVPAGVSLRFMSLAAATAVIATVVPSYLVNAGMSRIGAQSTAMISTLSPLITIVFAVALLGEHFGLMDAFGTLLVLSGIAYYTWRDLQSSRIQTIESKQP